MVLSSDLLMPNCCFMGVCQGSRLESTKPACRKLQVKWSFAFTPTLQRRLICTSLCIFFVNSAKILSIFCVFTTDLTIKIWRLEIKFLSLLRLGVLRGCYRPRFFLLRAGFLFSKVNNISNIMALSSNLVMRNSESAK